MRFELTLDAHGNEVIKDVEHNLNLFFLATSGMGTTATVMLLAERVVDYLNSLPPEETLLYPFNLKDSRANIASNKPA